MIYYCCKSCNKDYNSQHKAGIGIRDYLLDSLGLSSKSYSFQKTASGKPYALNADFDFSISHSNEIAICAVNLTNFNNIPENLPTDIIQISDSECLNGIGVDIEFVDYNQSTDKLSRISRKYFGHSVLNTDDFFQMWTKYESYGKLTGDGIFKIMKSSFNEKSLWYRTFTIDSDDKKYFAAFCANKNI